VTYRIAIVGLGRVGGEFLGEMLRYRERGFTIRAVAELQDTPAKAMAKEQGIEVTTLERIAEMGGELDVIFDLSGSRTVRTQLRDKLAAAGNMHTVIAPEIVGQMIWSLITDKTLPQVHRNLGY
jgi:predicted dinucleotide-utilizing enzyme